jgi:hypothetical protein
MYIVIIGVYASIFPEKSKSFDTYQEAFIFAQGASVLAEILWTRHCSIKGAVAHFDYYSDLFNEGFIIVEKA